MSAVSSTNSISPRQVATYNLKIAPSNGSYTNPVTFTASGLPAGASASFSQPAITPGANTTNFTLMISTTAGSFVPPGRTPQWPERGVPLVYIAGLAMAFLGIGLCASRTRMRGLAPQFLMAILLLMAGGLLACASGSGGIPRSKVVRR